MSPGPRAVIVGSLRIVEAGPPVPELRACVLSESALHILVIVAAAFGLGVTTTPLVRRLAIRIDMIDRPCGRRRHAAPVPLLGGVAIYVAVVATVALGIERYELSELLGILAGATLVAASGLWDDRFQLGVVAKLAIQGAAVVVVSASGVRTALPMSFGWAFAVSIVWVLGITNAFNLVDNLDGLCSGVGAVASLSFLVLAWLNGQYLVAGFAAALLGACLGFFVHNRSPASIFMGDAGSLFIGFLMAALGLKLRSRTGAPWGAGLAPILVLGVPIFDTLLVSFSRLRRGLNPATSPGTDHLSHRLLRLGFTRRGAAGAHYVATAVLGALALWINQGSLARAAVAITSLAATSVVLALGLDRRGLAG